MDEDYTLEKARKKRADNSRWLLTFVIWAAGVAVLSGIWDWQNSIQGALGETIAFVLYIVVFFYPFALVPIHEQVCRFLGDR